jgi:hypothetical protein
VPRVGCLHGLARCCSAKVARRRKMRGSDGWGHCPAWAAGVVASVIAVSAGLGLIG